MATPTFTGTADQVKAITELSGFDSNTILTITDADYDVAKLTAINDATNGKITLQKAAELLTGTLPELEAALTGIKYTGAISVSNTTTANIDAALQLTTGKVTATVAGTAADLLEAITPSATAKDALTLTVDAGIVAASVLKALDAKTSVAVNASAVTEITGTAAELKTVLAASTAATPTMTLGAAVAVTVDGKVSAADLNAFAKATTGAVTADIEGSAAALNAALKDVDGTVDDITVTLTGTSATAKDLIELTDKVTTLDVSSLRTITGDLTDINTVTTTYPSEVTVTITGTVPASSFAILNTIEAHTGVVKATVEGLASDLVQLTASSTDLLTLKVTNDIAVASDLILIDGKTAVVVNASAVKEISGIAADLKTIYASKTISGLGNEAVIITGAPSAKDANVILKATTGVVTATVADTATNLVKALTDAKATDALTLTVTGTATAAELKALDAKASTVTATGVTEITGNAKDVIAVLTADGIDLDGAVAVKVTGTVSASDANIIAGLTGKVTATVSAGTAADLNAKLIDAAGTDALKLTVNGKTAAATDLNGLDGKTSVDVKVDATEVTGDFTDLEAVYVTNKANFTNLGNETVKITDATVTAAQANTIADATTGKVTATVTADTADNLVDALANAVSTDALTLTVNATATEASDLILLDGKTSVDVIVNATTVEGTFAELNKVYVANKANFAALGNEAVTITDATVSAAQANTIANATTGVVTADVTAATAASLNAALKNAAADGSDALTLRVNGATATAADLNALDGKTKEVITVEAKAVTGTFADLNKVYVTNAANFSGLNDENVTITDKTVAVADANTIANVINGKVTATVAAGTSAVLDALTTVETDAITLTVTGDATALELNSLDSKTSVDVKVDATKVTGDYDDLYELYVTNKANFTALGNENITINAGATAAQVNTIANLTTGKVTATIADTAANLVAALTKSTGDALSLEVTGVAKAADLITLDGKTALDVTVTGVTAITGTYAELYKVYQTNALNFIGLGTQNVTITDKVTVDQINVIKELTTGDITAAVSGSAADLAKLNTVGATGDAITLTVSGTTAAAADLNTLNAKTSVNVNVAAVTTITGDAATVVTLYTASADFTGLGNEAVTVSGTATVGQAQTITGATTGKVTATVTDTADQLLTITNAVSSDALTLTATDATAAAAKLNTLDGRTSVAVKVDATAVAGTYSDLSKVYVTNKANFTGLGNETVTISDSVSAAQANTIALATTGVVTAAVAAATAATLNAALTDTTVNAYSLELTDTNLSSLTNLIALDGKTTGTVDAGSLLTISETFANLTTVYTSAGISELGNEAVTITDTQSAANVNTFALETIGNVTATITDGAVASTLAAILANVVANDVITFKTTDTTVDASNLVNLKLLVDTFNTASVTKITEDAASVSNVANALDILGADTQTTNVQITGGTITKTAFDLIDTNTAGSIDVSGITLAANDASAINLANLSSVTGLLTLNTVDSDGGDAINAITGSGAGGAITAADILALTGTTLTGGANDTIALAITGDAADTINLTGWTETGAGTKVYTNVVADGASSDTYTITVTDMVVTA